MVAGIDDLIIGSVASWAVSTALEGMIEQIIELEDALSEKLERLLQSPYKTGKNSLHLAIEYVRANQQEKALQQIDRAVKYFDQAGSQLDGLEQVHAYCLAGLCVFLRHDRVAKKHYFGLALKHLLDLRENELGLADHVKVAAKWYFKTKPKTINVGPFEIGNPNPVVNVRNSINSYKEFHHQQKQTRNVYAEGDTLPGFGCTFKTLENALIRVIEE